MPFFFEKGKCPSLTDYFNGHNLQGHHHGIPKLCGSLRNQWSRYGCLTWKVRSNCKHATHLCTSWSKYWWKDMLQAFSSRKGLKHVIQAPVVVRIVDWLQMVEVGNEFCCLTYKQKSNVASNSSITNQMSKHVQDTAICLFLLLLRWRMLRQGCCSLIDQVQLFDSTPFKQKGYTVKINV